MIEAGKVMALNLPVGANAATSRAVGCMVKLDFQRAMLQPHPADGGKSRSGISARRSSFATNTSASPRSGRPTRGATRSSLRCRARRNAFPIVATQSISSLAESTLPGESWRTLLQTFRTKIFLVPER